MALAAAAEEYFRTMNPLSAKIHEDIVEVKNSYENIWDSLTEKEKNEIIDETIIKPDIVIKYSLLDNLEFNLDQPTLKRNDLMSFFGHHHGQKMIQDETACYRDEHSAPFIYQTKSQLNLCILSDKRNKMDEKPSSPQVMSELAISHSKVVSELKSALKSHERFNEESSQGFISKLIGNFKSKDEERQCLVPIKNQTQVVASSDNFFRTNFKSPNTESKFDKDYRSSVVKSHSDLSEEHRGLLSSSQASSTDFQSTETLTETIMPKTGFDFLDNW